MRLLMVSGDRLLAAGNKGPFWHLQREFSKHFERIDVLHPRPDGPVVQTELFDGRLHLHPATCGRMGMLAYIKRRGRELIDEHRHGLIVSHDYGWFYNGLGSGWLSDKTGVPYLSEIHHVPGIPVAADLRERFDRMVAKRYVRWASSRARAFRVVNSMEMPALLQGWGVPAEKVLVLGSLYMDLQTFTPPTEPVEYEQDLVFVGRMVNNKGLDRIVDAVAELKAGGRAITALLVGSGAAAGSDARTRPRIAASPNSFASSTGSAKLRSSPTSIGRAALSFAPRPARAGRALRSKPWPAARRACRRASGS